MNLSQAFQPQNPLARMPGSGGGSALSAAISGKNQEAQLEASWKNANPEKTVGGGIMQAGMGAATGAQVGSMIGGAGGAAAGGSAAGGAAGLAGLSATGIGAIAGLGLGGLAYALS